MPTYRDQAIVLKTRPLRDADRHYALYTEAHGKVVVLAKGSRRGKSKLSPHLSSIGVVDVMIARGRVIDRLAGAGLVRPFRGIMDSLEKASLAQGFLLAVDALTKRELPDERIFRLLAEFLEAVEEAPVRHPGERDPLFDAGILKLMELLGVALDLRECVSCRNDLVPDGNALNVMAGGIECADCRHVAASTLSPEAIKALRFYCGGPVRAACSLQVPEATRREVGFVTDLLLTVHLEDRFDVLRYFKAVA